jgi:predicted dinucleotide-binding enzyme
MPNVEEGVVVAGLVTELIVTLRVLPPATTRVVIVTRREEELNLMQLEATEHEQVLVLERVTSIGMVTRMRELEMRELVVVNVRLYAVRALMEELTTEMEGAVILPVVNE